MSNRFFGELPSYPEGSIFLSRKELSRAGVDKPVQAGISGSQHEGTDSIVLSGAYEDEDHGAVIVYTGHGGRDAATGRQISNQTLTKGNLAFSQS